MKAKSGKRSDSMYHTFCRYFLVLIILLAGHHSFAQKRRVSYSAERMTGDKGVSADAKRLIGNVVFRDNGTTMYCDSAYFYSTTEDFDAYGHIKIVPDNSKTVLTGNVLRYRASDRMANINGNVLLKDQDAVLSTTIIFYNLNTSVANYPSFGKITTGNTTIVSEEGSFDRNTNQFLLKRKVRGVSPDGLIFADTMGYHTDTKTVEYLSPTFIINAKNLKDSVYCQRGWYDSQKRQSLFRRKAWLSMGGNKIWGDSLYFDEATNMGHACNNVEIRDSSQDLLIKANYVRYNRVLRNALATKKAMMVQVSHDSQKTDSLYLHADTIYFDRYTEITDTISCRVDTFRYVKAYHHVKFFKSDLQGKCDSLYYTLKDSSLQFIGKPVLWSENLQIKGNHIQLYSKHKSLDKMYVTGSAFIATQEDSVNFNQIRGRNMVGLFQNNKLSRLNVKGNGQFIYYAKDGALLVGVNKTESSDIAIYLKENKLSKITPINTIEGTFIPPHEIPTSDLKLKDFEWLGYMRPHSWRDIFKW